MSHHAPHPLWAARSMESWLIARGRPLHPEMMQALSDMLERDTVDARWKRTEYSMTGFRGGRNAALVARVVAGVHLFAERVLWVTATRGAAKDYLEALAEFFEPHQVSRAHGVYQIKAGTGDGRVLIVPGHDFGRGMTADLLILEKSDYDRALGVTLSASKNPQTIFNFPGELLD